MKLVCRLPILSNGNNELYLRILDYDALDEHKYDNDDIIINDGDDDVGYDDGRMMVMITVLVMWKKLVFVNKY